MQPLKNNKIYTISLQFNEKLYLPSNKMVRLINLILSYGNSLAQLLNQ